MLWLRRHSGAIIFALTLVAIILIIANAWKQQFVSAAWLKEQKDTFAAITSIVTAILLTAGGLFSYYRFFKGRILSLRAELSLSISVHPTSVEYLIHSITLVAKNVGSSTIWHPTPLITISFHGPPPLPPVETIADWVVPTSATSLRDTFPVIESEETVSFFAIREIPKKVWAVTYMASISADSGDVWFASRTITNAPNKNEPPGPA